MAKKQYQSFALPDSSSRESTFGDPSEANFPFRFVIDKPAFASTNSSDSGVPARKSQYPAFIYSSKYSQQSFDSDASSVLPMDARKPLPEVETTDYYKHLPSDWTDEQKTRQLLIWFMEREADIESSPETHVTAEAKRARLVAYRLKQKIIKDMKEGKMDVSCYNRPDNLEEVEEKENPINVANADKLEALSKANQNFSDEMHDWKNTRNQIYQAHAEAVDAIPENTVIRYEDVDVDFMLQHLHEDQQQFYEKYCVTEEMNTMEIPDSINPGITHIRQQLNTVNQFQSHARKALGQQESKLAQKLYEGSQYIPKGRHQNRVPHLEIVLKDVLSEPTREDNSITDN